MLALLRRLPLLRNLTEDELMDVLGLLEYITLSRGGSCSLEGEAGEALFLVEEGTVKLVEHGRNGELTLAIFAADDWLDEYALFTPIFKSHYLEALTSARLARLEKPVLEEFLQSRPGLSWRLLENMAMLTCSGIPVAKRHMQSLEVRLARYLLGLAESRGIISPGGLVIDYPLQVVDIQVAVGAREGDMVQALRSLVAQDVLDLSERLVITNLEQLKSLAYGQGGLDSV